MSAGEKLIGNHLFSTGKVSYCKECERETATRIKGSGREAEYICCKCRCEK